MTNSSNAAISFPLKPWVTPNFATVEFPARPKQEGVQALPSIALADLPAEALDRLVAQWRAEVYQKAGIQAPEDRFTKDRTNV